MGRPRARDEGLAIAQGVSCAAIEVWPAALDAELRARHGAEAGPLARADGRPPARGGRRAVAPAGARWRLTPELRLLAGASAVAL